MVEHGGNINGFTATNAWVPDLNLGIYMDVNRDVALLPDAVVHELIDSFLREAGEMVPDAGWKDRIYKYNSDMFESVKKLFLSFGGEAIPGTSPSHEMAAYAGWYEAPGYRRVLITEENGALTLDFNHFIVGLKHHHYDTFATTGLLGELPSGLNVRFETRADGVVDRVVMLLGSEKDLDPIVFIRKEEERN